MVILPGDNTRLTTRGIDGRLQSVTGGAVVDEAWAYDVDEDGNLVTTRWTYDGLGRVLTEAAPRGAVTTTAWRADGKIDTVTDPIGNVTTPRCRASRSLGPPPTRMATRPATALPAASPPATPGSTASCNP